MQYCNKSLIKNNNEILQYFNKNNDIALVMHQRALLDMSDAYIVGKYKHFGIKITVACHKLVINQIKVN